MKWQGIVMILLIAMDVIQAAILDGEPKKGQYNVGATLIAESLMVWLLYSAGFWN